MAKVQNPVQFCDSLSKRHVQDTKPMDRKKRGQFFTPTEIAMFMAGLGEYENDTLRVLDPGAGTGILSCAVCEKAAASGIIRKITIDAYEDDPKLIKVLNKSFKFTKEWLSGKKYSA